MSGEVSGKNGGSGESKQSESQRLSKASEEQKGSEAQNGREQGRQTEARNGSGGASGPGEQVAGNSGANDANGALKMGTGEAGKNGEPAHKAEEHLNGDATNGKVNGEPPKAAGAKGRGPTRAQIEVVEPWPERVNLAEVLDEIV